MASILRLSQRFQFIQKFSHSISGAQFSGSRMLSAKGVLCAFPQKNNKIGKKQVVKQKKRKCRTKQKWKTGDQKVMWTGQQKRGKDKGENAVFLSEVH